MLDGATSGYWPVILGSASSLLTTLNTLLSKLRWLILPFELKVASDVFQEWLDKVSRLLDAVRGITDDILTHSKIRFNMVVWTSSTHEQPITQLKENSFKSEDSEFFGYRWTQEGNQIMKNQNCGNFMFMEFQCVVKEIYSSLNWTLRPFLQTMQTKNNLVMRIWSTTSIWENAISPSILWQKYRSHLLDWCNKNWIRCNQPVYKHGNVCALVPQKRFRQKNDGTWKFHQGIGLSVSLLQDNEAFYKHWNSFKKQIGNSDRMKCVHFDPAKRFRQENLEISSRVHPKLETVIAWLLWKEKFRCEILEPKKRGFSKWSLAGLANLLGRNIPNVEMKFIKIKLKT